jgi:hypothetical protein
MYADVEITLALCHAADAATTPVSGSLESISRGSKASSSN